MLYAVMNAPPHLDFLCSPTKSKIPKQCFVEELDFVVKTVGVLFGVQSTTWCLKKVMQFVFSNYTSVRPQKFSCKEYP